MRSREANNYASLDPPRQSMALRFGLSDPISHFFFGLGEAMVGEEAPSRLTSVSLMNALQGS